MRSLLPLTRVFGFFVLLCGLATASASAQAPVFTSVPAARQVVTLNQDLTLTVAATGATSYQWKRNGLAISGATNASYTITAAKSYRDNGWYRAIATNASGSTTSAVVFVNVAVNPAHVSGVGSTASNRLAIPAGLNAVISVQTGATGAHSLALKADGTVVAWGQNDYGQTTIPTGLSGVVALAAGGSHNVALKADGTVVTWGRNNYGQTTIPTGLSGVVAIAAGGSHNVALKADGTVVAWGYAGDGYTTIPSGLIGVVAIAVGDSHNVALKADGAVVAWGNSFNGQTTIPSGLSGVVAIAAGGYHNVALKADGTVVGWGHGQTTIPSGLSGVVAVAGGLRHSLALKADGTVVAWGYNSGGETTIPSGLNTVVAVAGGDEFSIFLRDASGDIAPTITSQPASFARNLGEGATFSVGASVGTWPLSFQWRKAGTNISGATSASYAIGEVIAASAGSYDVVVSNYLGSVTSTAATLTVNSSPVVNATSHGRYVLGTGQSLTLALDSAIASGATVQWKRSGFAIAGATNRSLSITNATPADSGYYQAVFDDGSGVVTSAPIFVTVAPASTQIVGWGGNSFMSGIASISDAVMIDTAGITTAALRRDGTVVVGGTQYPVPSGLSNVVSIVVGGDYELGDAILALKADGTVVAWGRDDYGASTVPTGLTGVVAIASSHTHSLAVRRDGTVVAWGSAASGATSVPVGLTGVAAVAAGRFFSLALKSDGTVVGWGANLLGQTTIPSGLSGVAGIAAGAYFSLAQKSDGTVVAWGRNTAGETGIPSGLAGVTGIAAVGHYNISDLSAHALALKSDGTVVAWGGNNYGQSVPPSGLGQVVGVAAGVYHSLALRDTSGDSTPAITSHPSSLSAFAGQDVTLRMSATGGTALISYQWRKGGANITGATNSTLFLPEITSASAGNYDVVVSNQLGTATSSLAVLTVNDAAGVSISPSGRQLIPLGQTPTLTATALIAGPVTFQWRKDGRDIVGATNASYTLPPAGARDSGAYQVVATNVIGPVVSGPTFVAVSLGSQLVSWGYNGSGQTTIPSGLGSPLSVAAGSNHSLAIKQDGTVVAWGSNANGQTNVPPGLAGVVAVAAGPTFSMALKSDATVVTWGTINYTPTGLTKVIAIAAGADYAMALRSDLTTVAWSSGNIATDIPSELSSVAAFGAGSQTAFRLAAKLGGKLVAWGSNTNGVATIPMGLADVTSVGPGSNHALAVTSAGTVTAWGSSFYGQTTVPFGLVGVIAVTAGEASSYALKSNGTVVGWGLQFNGSGYGSLSIPSTVGNVFQIASGGNHVLALRDPSLDTAPMITSANSATFTVGVPVSFTVAATGSPAPTFSFSGGIPGWLSMNSTTGVWSGTPNVGTSGTPITISASNGVGAAATQIFSIIVNAPPSITSSPGSQTPFAGQTLTLSATATGSPAPTFQWHKGSAAISGATNASLALNPVQVADAGSYDVVVSNVAGTVTSSPFTITVQIPTAPSISVHPAGGTLNVSNVGTFGVTASGNPAPSYQWRKDGVPVTGATGTTSSFLSLGPVTTASAGTYDVVVSNVGGTVISNPAVLTVNPASISILSQPASVTTHLGSSVSLSISVIGVPGAPSYQWRKNGVNVPGATAATLPFPSVQLADAGSYDVVATNGFVTVVSASANLAVGNSAPSIVTAPGGVTVAVGGSAVLSVVANGNSPLTYQWHRDGVPISGATQSIYTLVNAQTHDRGDYTVTITNALGTVTSTAARVNVVPRVVAYSARVVLDDAGAVATFVIEGALAKKVLLRAVGPGLAPFGLAGLPDPALELFDSSGNLVALNDDWSTSTDAAQIASTAAGVGAFALALGGKDAALVRTLAPGAYSVRARPATGAGGVGYLELYDADLATGPISTVPLVAVRGRMAAGGGVVIGGLGSNGRGQRSYLLRAVGPGLGLAGALADPALLVVRSSSLVGQNDNWDAVAADAAAVTAATTRVAAFSLPAAGRDAGLVLTGNLHAGAATAEISGAGVLGGTVLVELHDLDVARPSSFAPVIVSPPVPTIVTAGGSATLRVRAHGTAPLSYQWRRNGVPVTGATADALVLENVTGAAAGPYTVIVANSFGSSTSLAAALTVASATDTSIASHAVVGGGYAAGAPVTISAQLQASAGATALGWSVDLPPGWSYLSDTATAAASRPASGATGTIEWAWSEVPASGVLNFAFTVAVPSGNAGDRTVTARGLVRFESGLVTTLAAPSPLTISQLTSHTADLNADNRLDLAELLRVIQLYNARHNGVRTGAYAVATTTTEDGFAPDLVRTGSGTLTRYHSADTNRDGRLSLVELTRVIELYNVRVGTNRTGQYKIQPGTEDGFGLGP